MKLLTKGSADALASDDLNYREIFTELRDRMTLRQFCELVGSTKSIAYWSKYERGEFDTLPIEQRNELRRAVMPNNLLPEPVSMLPDILDPNAAIWQLDGGKTGVIVFDGDKYPEAHSTFALALCTPVTRPRSERCYRDLFDLPVKRLAQAIREREDVVLS